MSHREELQNYLYEVMASTRKHKTLPEFARRDWKFFGDCEPSLAQLIEDRAMQGIDTLCVVDPATREERKEIIQWFKIQFEYSIRNPSVQAMALVVETDSWACVSPFRTPTEWQERSQKH